MAKPMTQDVRPSAEDADKHLAFAEAALAPAGHEVTDPVLRDLLERKARGEISAEEALAAARAHIQN
ncbi:hypothetical protein [Brevibacterium samyangense]|uniref:Antitoxin VbhA domain-containing protein n=1 Tax=Brevibacterium samyangense TaxID=366888 RepID=A0ABP5ET81_9MICO